jgi:hypothetical protein
LLGIEVPVDLLKVSQLLAVLPGIQACIIAARKSVINGGDLPAGLDPESIGELGRRMSRALDKKPQAFRCWRSPARDRCMPIASRSASSRAAKPAFAPCTARASFFPAFARSSPQSPTNWVA